MDDPGETDNNKLDDDICSSLPRPSGQNSFSATTRKRKNALNFKLFCLCFIIYYIEKPKTIYYIEKPKTDAKAGFQFLPVSEDRHIG
jgi:hypothetical protein